MPKLLGRRLITRLRRLLLYRLIMPVLRAKHPPEYTGRSVLFGMLIAMTPTVGIQMPIVFMIWLPLHFLRPQWDFNVVIAMAWTWVTNIFTMGPIYYAFLVTGRVMLGDADDLTGYEGFALLLSEAMATDADFLQSLWIYTVDLFRIWGIPMFVGSIPWAIITSWLSYRWTIQLVNRFRRRRQDKAAARRASH
ncbi:MAG: DUF2062 domain-containing protein [Pseudomonadota bacterium]|nr:DUF2062 domain-containing protein [Pseudomonadota bacterium]